jgi:preprotein translocase SecE subunit
MGAFGGIGAPGCAGLRTEQVRAVAQEQRPGAGPQGRWGRLKGFFGDAWLELQKVIWPTREDVVKMTGLVVVVVFLVGGYIFLWAQLLGVITRPLLAE